MTDRARAEYQLALADRHLQGAKDARDKKKAELREAEYRLDQAYREFNEAQARLAVAATDREGERG